MPHGRLCLRRTDGNWTVGHSSMTLDKGRCCSTIHAMRSIERPGKDVLSPCSALLSYYGCDVASTQPSGAARALRFHWGQPKLQVYHSLGCEVLYMLHLVQKAVLAPQQSAWSCDLLFDHVFFMRSTHACPHAECGEDHLPLCFGSGHIEISWPEQRIKGHRLHPTQQLLPDGSTLLHDLGHLQSQASLCQTNILQAVPDKEALRSDLCHNTAHTAQPAAH